MSPYSSTALYTQKKDPGKRDGKPDPFYTCHDGGHQGHTIDDCPYSQRNIKAQAKSAPESTNLMTVRATLTVLMNNSSLKI
jgi:hypothetical protein